MKTLAGRARAFAAVFVVSSLCGCAAPLSRTALPPPVPGEAHGMTGADRRTALAVLRSHYRNILDAYGPLRLTGVEWSDPSKPARCEVLVSLSTAGYREGSFVEGLPVRRAQPLVFNEIQQQLVAGVTRCAGSAGMAFTTRTWEELEQSALALALRNSGTTFCLQDEDCYGVEATDPCGSRPAQSLFGSAATDAVFAVAYRKFLPSFMNAASQMVNGARGQLGDKHPDKGAPLGTGCPMKHWQERPIEAVCVNHACRAKTPDLEPR